MTFHQYVLTHLTGWFLPLEFTLLRTTDYLSFCQWYILSYVPRKSLSLSHCSGLAMCPSSCFAQNFCLTLLMLCTPWLFVSQPLPLSHSSLVVLQDDRNSPFSREFPLLTVKWPEQCEWTAFILAVWTQNTNRQ